VYAVLSGINTLIVRVHNRDALFREACRTAVEAGAFKMAWIGVIDPVICNDIAADPTLGELRNELLERGYRSLGCFPLTLGVRPAAVIALFAGEPNAFDEEETRLLLELSSDIAFALVGHIEKEEKLNYLAYYGSVAFQTFQQRRDQIDRQREHDGRTLLAGNVGERLQIAQL
jgi:hypothetical protein